MAMPWQCHDNSLAIAWYGMTWDGMAWPWQCHGNAMALRCHCCGAATAMSWQCHGQNHGNTSNAMAMLWHCATPLPWRCHGTAMAMPWQGRRDLGNKRCHPTQQDHTYKYKEMTLAQMCNLLRHAIACHDTPCQDIPWHVKDAMALHSNLTGKPVKQAVLIQ